MNTICVECNSLNLNYCILVGLRRSSQGRAAVADHRRPIRSRRPHLGIHHSTVLANGLHLGSRSRPRYPGKYLLRNQKTSVYSNFSFAADRATMVVLPPEAAQMAEGQARPRRVRQQVKEKEVKC